MADPLLSLSTPIGFPVDLLRRDVLALKSTLVAYLKQRDTNYSDFVESALGITLVEMIAYAYAVIGFYQDRLANEVYIDTIRERRNMLLATRLIGYKMQNPSAASVDVTISAESLAPYPTVVIAAGAAFGSSNGVPFEFVRDFTINKIATDLWTVNGVQQAVSVRIPAVQGQTNEQTETGTGLPFQEYVLTKSPVLDKTVTVLVDGMPFTEVEALVIGDPEDRSNQDIFELALDEDGRARARFGDGTVGRMPPVGSVIEFAYRIGGGSQGNVPAGSINASVIATGDGNPISLPITNETAATGGADPEDIEHARFFAPLTVKTVGQAVTYNDFFALANGFSSAAYGRIAKAGIVAYPTDGLANVVTIYAFTADAEGNLIGGASSALKESLLNFLNSRRVLCVGLNVLDGTLVPVDVGAKIRLKAGFDTDEVRAAVRAAIEKVFLDERVRFGNELRGSWLYDAVQSVAGVEWCDLSPTDGTNISNFDPDNSMEDTGHLAQVLYEENLQVVQPSGTSAPLNWIAVPVLPGAATTVWGVYQASKAVYEDILVSFKVVDVSLASPAGAQAYTAPTPGTAFNPYLSIVDQFLFVNQKTISNLNLNVASGNVSVSASSVPYVAIVAGSLHITTIDGGGVVRSYKDNGSGGFTQEAGTASAINTGTVNYTNGAITLDIAATIALAYATWDYVDSTYGLPANANILIVDKPATPTGSATPLFRTYSGAGTGCRVRLTHARLMKLRAGEVVVNDQFKYHTVLISSGTGAGQERTILQSWTAVGSLHPLFVDSILVDRDWTTFPDSSSEYQILGNLAVPPSHALVVGNIEITVLDTDALSV